MRCNECQSETDVKDSRIRIDENGNDVVYRRRLCRGCGIKYTTYEFTEDKYLQQEKNATKTLVKIHQLIERLGLGNV